MLQDLSAGSHLQRTIWTTGLPKRLKENNQQDIEETWRLSWGELMICACHAGLPSVQFKVSNEFYPMFFFLLIGFP